MACPRHAALALSVALSTLIACSSNHSASSNTNDAGGLVGHDVNPDGVAYPTAAIGRDARRGSAPGSVMQNYKFLGYPGADPSRGLQTISLADYYDPCNKRLKLLRLNVAAVWCAPCNQETDAIVAGKAQLDAQGVVILQALDDGRAQGVPATQSDLDFWINRHKSNFTEMLDPGLVNLSGFFNPASLPWNGDIDPRTMEIVAAGVGLQTDASIGLAALPAMPGYPIPVTCN